MSLSKKQRRSSGETPQVAVIYTRVSTNEQTKGHSLQQQEEKCREFCVQRGWEVDRVFVDRGESARSTDREEFRKMLVFCQKNRGRIGYVVVLNLTRFARNTEDHQMVRAELVRFGVYLRSVQEPIDESSTGRLIENVGAAFAEFDNSRRTETTVMGMKAKVQRGGWPFPAPLGYQKIGFRKDSRLVPDAESAPLIRRAFELMGTGVHTAKQVLDLVSAQGLRTKKGKKVAPQTFHRILRNPIYVGRVAVGPWGIDALGDFEPIVSADLFESVQRVLDGNKPSVTAYQRNNPEFPLRRFVLCGGCGTPMTGSSSKGRGGTYRYYKCRLAGCTGTNVRKEALETGFLSLLKDLTPNPKLIEAFRAVATDAWRERSADAGAVLSNLERRIEQLQKRLDDLDEAFIYERRIQRPVYEKERGRLGNELVEVETQRNRPKDESLDVDAALDFAVRLLRSPSHAWWSADLDQKQRLQKVFFPTGLRFREGRFETPETGILFKGIAAISRGEYRLVAHTGFEPVLPP